MHSEQSASIEHVDVLIVGAGISGTGAAYYLKTMQPAKTFAIVEARYPAIRSDSDLHTFSYEFKPWQHEREPLYFNGARMVGNYPMSLVLDGQALNITLTSTADSLDFGVVGCRRSVPHVQRVLSHLETSLKELERAVGL